MLYDGRPNGLSGGAETLPTNRLRFEARRETCDQWPPFAIACCTDGRDNEAW